MAERALETSSRTCVYISEKTDEIPVQRPAKNRGEAENFLPDIFISSHISEIFAWTDPDPLLTTRKLYLFLCTRCCYSFFLKPERMIAGPTTSTISFHHEQRLVIAWISVSCGFRGNCSHCCRNRGNIKPCDYYEITPRVLNFSTVIAGDFRRSCSTFARFENF